MHPIEEVANIEMTSFVDFRNDPTMKLRFGYSWNLGEA